MTVLDRKVYEKHGETKYPRISPREYRDRLRREALERVYEKLRDVTDGPSFLFSDNFGEMRELMSEVEKPDWIKDVMRKGVNSGKHYPLELTADTMMELKQATDNDPSEEEDDLFEGDEEPFDWTEDIEESDEPNEYEEQTKEAPKPLRFYQKWWQNTKSFFGRFRR